MAVVMFVAGLAVLVITAREVFMTAVTVTGGGGPVTSVLTSRMWRVVRRLAGGSHRVLAGLGPAVACGGLFLWISGAWLGWGLLFLSGASVEASTSGRPAGAWERLYFVGYSLTTLGNGEFKPAGAGWQLATVLVSATGLTLVTLTLTYIISLVSAVVDQRSVASLVHALGETPEEICARVWNGDDFRAIVPQLDSLNPAVSKLAQRHLAYPVLAYFHSRRRAEASAPNLAVLDEALTLMCRAVPPGHRLEGLAVTQSRAVIAGLAATVDNGRESPSAPPVPSLESLRERGIPTVGRAEFEAVFREHAGRRSALATLVRYQGWGWDNVRPS
ncbi:hypothetical protein HDA32_002776 [Spinactinospora alkalitolerans]|uniref:Potassium channel domain-containing protein n=1 Tax=Spinactinospora alkalitolerans TaxID=687207 RepID=A0A852TT88_9ACTN|nr:ion channel [Spinactinospora alkalitolerans]NYE47656.1 hypothetical protein [Spinactinospora alkalitolerans]